MKVPLTMNSNPAAYGSLPPAALDALSDLTSRLIKDPTIIALILTGSAARGLATKHSDVDVIVVRDEVLSTHTTTWSSAIDEIPMTLSELETIKPIGTEGAWERWSFAWSQILYSSPSFTRRVSEAVHRQATLTDQEIRDLLIGRSRLDEFINFCYRSLKSFRDGRPKVARLDAAEAVASFLDVVFALKGRVRPYNKYLAWESKEHGLEGEEWREETLLSRINGLLDGSEKAVRESFLAIEQECRAYDQRLGRSEMREVIHAWGEQLRLLRGTSAEEASL
jgi:predicted nucleotidyltransferase